MKRIFKLIAIVGLAATLTTTVWAQSKTAFAGPPALSWDLQSQPATGNTEVIVQYKVQPTQAHHQQVAALGGRLLGTTPHINGAHYLVPNSALQALLGVNDVAYITPNRAVNARFDQITDDTVHSNQANSSGYTGAGIGVAIIDSGVADLPDFYTGGTSRIVYQQSFVGTEGGADPDGNSAADEYGHGTHVAGILAGNGNGTVYVGIAPQANIINLRVLDVNGNGSIAAVIQAVDTAISLKSQYNIKVISMSLGSGIFESYTLDPLCQEVEAAWQAGITVVVAAGNEGRNDSAGTNGYGTIASPGNDPFVITVGAMSSMQTSNRSDDIMASYSSKGPTLFDTIAKPDIIAPGNQIVSTLPPGMTIWNELPGNQVTGNYFGNNQLHSHGGGVKYLNG